MHKHSKSLTRREVFPDWMHEIMNMYMPCPMPAWRVVGSWIPSRCCWEWKPQFPECNIIC